MEEYDTVSKISIVPRGVEGGVTIFTPDEETLQNGLYSKRYLLDRICVSMGGRISEEILNGKQKVTSASAKDIQSATNIAKVMVEQYGMSDKIGPRFAEYPANTIPHPKDKLRAQLDDEIDRILREQTERGTQIIMENRELLDTISEHLIKYETLERSDI